MAAALRRAGHTVTHVEVPDLHNYTAWRDALDPHLTAVLRVAGLREDEAVQGHRVELQVPGTDHRLGVIRHGHWGRPVLVFPSEAGRAEDFATNGMVGAVQHLVDEGRVSFFCVDSLDGWSWSDASVPTEERARRHAAYQAWLDQRCVPWITESVGAGHELITLGASMGAYHAVHFAFQRADLAPLAIGLSGNYDVGTWHAWGERGDAAYFANPTDYVPTCTATT